MIDLLLVKNVINFRGTNFHGFLAERRSLQYISRNLISADFAHRDVKFRNKEHVNGIMLYHILNFLFSKISLDFIFTDRRNLQDFAGLNFRGFLAICEN